MTWGVTTSRIDRPKFINDPEILKSAILTHRGWECRAQGNNNPAAMEVLVAGNFGRTAANAAPEVYQQYYRLSDGFSGVSGSAVSHSGIEVSDPDKTLDGDVVTIGSSSGFPAGITLTKVATTIDNLDFFVISGTVDFATSGVATIVFSDTAGLTVGAEIPYTITAS